MAEGALISDVLAAAVVAVATYCAGRLVVAGLWRRRIHPDVDLCHAVMGASMGAMLLGWLTGTWVAVATLTFAGGTGWFGWQVVRELGSDVGGSPHRPAAVSQGSHVVHLVACVAMVYMLLAARWTSTGAGGGMHMAGTTSPGTEVLGVVVALLLVGDALFSAGWGLVRPRPAIGAAASPGGGGTGTLPGGWSARTPRSGVGGAGSALAPRAPAVCLMVMSVAMAYMFLTVRV